MIIADYSENGKTANYVDKTSEYLLRKNGQISYLRRIDYKNIL